ncbi:MAG TPA: glycosyltransferase family 9 protein [Pyrinomonadaceae bacterium]|nr:glycosyltransferase family 9 protein [Pyrinomonadaceae bacterium]
MRTAEIDWNRVRRVLVVRLRSIGDTVLATPSLVALRRFLPESEIDILVEDWVAPVLDDFEGAGRLVAPAGGALSRLATAREIRRRNYDVVFNLHGGTTATFFARASGAPHRVGYENYHYSFLYNHRLSSAKDFWKREKTHSAEQQLALLGFVGIPVNDLPKSRLTVSEKALNSGEQKLMEQGGKHLDKLGEFVLMHPAAAFDTKEWAAENFARVAEFLQSIGLTTIAIATPQERRVLDNLKAQSSAPIYAFDNFTLPEITALASRARLFVGNDSGIAHMAAATGTPSVVIFGSSNRHHWRPWTDAPNEVVFEGFNCQPCPGFECKEFGEPRCIHNVTVESVTDAIGRVLAKERAGPKARS